MCISTSKLMNVIFSLSIFQIACTLVINCIYCMRGTVCDTNMYKLFTRSQLEKNLYN